MGTSDRHTRGPGAGSRPRDDGGGAPSSRRRRTGVAAGRRGRRMMSATRGGGRDAQWPLDRLEEVLLAASVFLGVAAIGAVHPPTMLAVSVPILLALGVTARGARRGERPWLEPPALVMWGLAGVCLLQSVSLPMAWLEALSPRAAETWLLSRVPLAESAPTWAPLSLDPGASRIQALRWFSYGAVFIVASSVGRRRGAAAGPTFVFGLALFVGGATMAHGLLGAEQVWGVYRPEFSPSSPWHVGPLLNPNNMAGMLNLGVLCGLGLLLERRPPVPRPLLFVGLALLVGAIVASGSRGAMMTLLLGSVALCGLFLRQRSQRGHRWYAGASLGRVGGVFVVACVLAVLGGRGAGYAALLDQNLDKLAVASWVRPMIADHAWFGIGRGAFESVFPAYQPADGFKTFTHAENFLVQWTVEWGALATGAALVAFGFLFRPRRLAVRDRPAAWAAYVAVITTLIHNLVDLGLEIPGLALAVSVLLGSGWGAVSRRARRPTTPARRPRLTAALTLALGVVVVGAATTGRRDLQSYERRIRTALVDHQPPRGAEVRQRLRHDIREAIRRHPAAPYFPFAGAVVAWDAGDASPMPWLQRALQRSRANGRIHFLLARVLRDRGATAQARMELRLAAERDPGVVGIAAVLALRWSQTLEEFAQAVPVGPPAAAMWSVCGRTEGRDRGRACDTRAVALDPTLVAPRLRLVEDRVAAVTEGKPCPGCAMEIEAHAAALDRHHPGRAAPHLVRARWQAATGDPVAAVKRLETVCSEVYDALACTRGRADLAAGIEGVEPFASVASRLRKLGCARRSSCAEVTMWVGDRHAERKEWGSAVAAYERAVAADPSDVPLRRLARAASQAGRHGLALRTLEKVLARTDGDDHAELRRRIAAERDKTVRRLLDR